MHPGGKTSILVVSQVDWFISVKIKDLGQWVFSGYVCVGGWGGGEWMGSAEDVSAPWRQAAGWLSVKWIGLFLLKSRI